METFISIIFFTVVGLYLLGLMGKFLLRRWILKKQREFQEQFGGQAGQGQSYRQSWSFGGNRHNEPSKEGEIKVETSVNNSEKRIKKDVGEYVDYEEIKK